MYMHYISNTLPLAYDTMQEKDVQSVSEQRQKLITELKQIEDEPEAKKYIHFLEQNLWESSEDLDKFGTFLNSN